MEPDQESERPLAILRDLWALSHALEARSKWMHRRHGITGPQRLVLKAIGRRRTCSPGEVARELHLDPATVTRLVAGLGVLGLVRRAGDRSDRRRVLLGLTRRGRRIVSRRSGTVEEAVRGALEVAGAQDVAAVRAFIGLLTRRLLPERPGR